MKRIELTRSLKIVSVLWIPDKMFQDMSKFAKLAADVSDMLLMGNLVNWLCDRSRLSILQSVNMLSGRDLNLLWDRSTIRSFFKGFRASAGISIISFHEKSSTCRFLVFLKQSKSTSDNSLCFRSSHCRCGMLPKMPWVMFLSRLFDRYRWVSEYSTGLK